MSKAEAGASLLQDQINVRSYNDNYVQTYDYPPPQPGGYFQREGFLSSSPQAPAKESMIYVPSTQWTWAFVIVVILQASIGLALEVYVLNVLR